MNKILLKNFFKDSWGRIFVYSLNSFLLIFYFNLISLKKSEILYPTIISLFLLCIASAFDWVKYYKFNFSLDNMIKDSNYKLDVVTCEQRKVNEVLRSINEKYIVQLSKIKSDYEWKASFISKWIHELKTPISVIDLII